MFRSTKVRRIYDNKKCELSVKMVRIRIFYKVTTNSKYE